MQWRRGKQLFLSVKKTFQKFVGKHLQWIALLGQAVDCNIFLHSIPSWKFCIVFQRSVFPGDMWANAFKQVTCFSADKKYIETNNKYLI